MSSLDPNQRVGIWIFYGPINVKYNNPLYIIRLSASAMFKICVWFLIGPLLARSGQLRREGDQSGAGHAYMCVS